MDKKTKDYFKMLMQQGVLPAIYKHYEKNTEVKKGKILFADSNQKGLSSEMKPVYLALTDRRFIPGI